MFIENYCYLLIIIKCNFYFIHSNFKYVVCYYQINIVLK